MESSACECMCRCVECCCIRVVTLVSRVLCVAWQLNKEAAAGALGARLCRGSLLPVARLSFLSGPRRLGCWDGPGSSEGFPLPRQRPQVFQVLMPGQGRRPRAGRPPWPSSGPSWLPRPTPTRCASRSPVGLLPRPCRTCFVARSRGPVNGGQARCWRASPGAGEILRQAR